MTTSSGLLKHKKWEISHFVPKSKGYGALPGLLCPLQPLRIMPAVPFSCQQAVTEQKARSNSLSNTVCSVLVPKQKPGILTFGEHVLAATNDKLRGSARTARKV